MVNLLIIGAQKAGTTSLYHYLKQHPEIYFSEVKEVTYFVNDELFEKGDDYYHSFFPKYNEEKIKASAYVHMLPSEKAPQRVFDYNPNMKFIVMLRDPLERAYSAYNYALKNGWEDKNVNFEQALELEPERIKNEAFDLTYFYNGLYNKHLKCWQQYFPQENFLLIWDTDLRSEPKEVLGKICEFLNIGNKENIDVTKEFNKAGRVRFKGLQKFLLSKNSVIKKSSGKLIPRSKRVWIRSNIISKLYSFNHVNNLNPQLNLELKKKLELYFKNDSK